MDALVSILCTVCICDRKFLKCLFSQIFTGETFIFSLLGDTTFLWSTFFYIQLIYKSAKKVSVIYICLPYFPSSVFFSTFLKIYLKNNTNNCLFSSINQSRVFFYTLNVFLPFLPKFKILWSIVVYSPSIHSQTFLAKFLWILLLVCDLFLFFSHYHTLLLMKML